MMRKFFLIFATILCLCGQAAAQNDIMTIISDDPEDELRFPPEIFDVIDD